MTEFGIQPQFGFSNGSLHIVTASSSMRLRFDPIPCAEQRDRRGRWKEFWPEFRVIARIDASVRMTTDSSKAKREAFAAFRRTVPQALCRIAEPFPSHQWLLLQLIHDSGPGRELAETNPILAYALANSYEFRRTSPDAAALQSRLHGRDKQKDLCKWLGFPGTPAVAKLLQRIRPEAASPSILRRLRNVLQAQYEGTMSLLRHRKQINAGVLEFVVIPQLAQLATPKLLDEIGAADQEERYPVVADQLIHAFQLLKQIQSHRRLRPFQSIRQIEDFVEVVDNEYLAYQQRLEEERQARIEAVERAERARRVARVRARRVARADGLTPNNCVWPPPPIPGTTDIVPITSYSMLCEESSEQSNCVRSYWRTVAGEHGRTYVYRLLRPERATFTIVRRSGNTWYLSQIKRKNNKKVSPRTRRTVEKWLYGHSLSAALPF